MPVKLELVMASGAPAVVGVTMTVPEVRGPLALMEPVPTVRVSAFKVMVESLAVMLLLTKFSTPAAPVPVVRVMPVGPEIAPFNVMLLSLTRVTEPEVELALKLTAPELFRLMTPVAVALRLPVVVLNAMPLPMVLPVRLTVPAVISGEPELLMAPPTSTVTVLPVAVIVPALANEEEPVVLSKARLALTLRAPDTEMAPV